MDQGQLGLLSMHEMPGVGHCTAESLTDGLMPQTDAEKGDAARQLPHSRLADAGLRRPTGPGERIKWLGDKRRISSTLNSSLRTTQMSGLRLPTS